MAKIKKPKAPKVPKAGKKPKAGKGGLAMPFPTDGKKKKKDYELK